MPEYCSLCQGTGERLAWHSGHVYHCSKCYCGAYFVERCDYEDWLENSKRILDLRNHGLSALFRRLFVERGSISNGHEREAFFVQFESKSYPEIPASIPIKIEELNTRWPSSVAERLDLALLNLACLSPHGGHWLPVVADDFPLWFARTKDEGLYHRKALQELGRIGDTVDGKLQITPNGWGHASELQRSRSSEANPAFVAMWFGGDKKKAEMEEVWKAIKEACKKTGWRANRSDTDPHSDFIMNKVLGDIRRAPFVVADFTGNRNGVYLEAGFARGLGIPVVHTCRADHFEKAHFDIKQINTIKWRDTTALREGVTQFIRNSATIGYGPERVPGDDT